MPDPQTLKVGDRIRFTELPEEWSRKDSTTPADTIRFMKKMIRRSNPSRGCEIDEYGQPWIHAFTVERGRRQFHSYAIFELTGWRRVIKRPPKRTKYADKRHP
ncbi:MAG: hypothetical protein JNG89_20755 [Planctomycetaceae bacterium]|nr:hypothetical protein [Planctomycetaceae bacterium]